MKYLFQKVAVLALAFGIISCTSNTKQDLEYYETKVFQISSAENQKKVLDFLEDAYVPALQNMGLSNIGIFVNADMKAADHSVYMLVPYCTLEQYSGISEALENDMAFQKAAAKFYAEPKTAPPYERIESSFFKAFSSIPFIELPEESVNKTDRIFEMRCYESHNDKMAALKRDMFNAGKETQLMRDLKMDPVFFGECLSGKNYPNLTYMLSASSMEESKAYWETFKKSPQWAEMKEIEKYKGTVSKIIQIYLKPVNFSGI
jgi:hypothetical protein